MTPRPLAVLCLLALSGVVNAAPQAGQETPPARAQVGSGAPAPPAKSGPKTPRMIYNTVPDTGQFLPDSVVLVRVNDRVIRVGEFVERFFNSWAEFRPRPDSAGRVEFLNTLVKKEVMAHVARQAGRPETFEDRIVMREHGQRVLSNVLFQRAVLDSIQEPTEEEIRKVYDQLGYELRLGQLLFPSRDLAERVRRDLRDRRITWADATMRYAPPATDTLARGDLGWLRTAALPLAIAGTVFDLKPGEISSVLPDLAGYSIYRAAERRNIPAITYQAMRFTLRNEIRNLRIDEQNERMLGGLRTKVGVVYDSATIAWAASRFSAPVSMSAGPRPIIEIEAGVPSFPPEDTSRVLLRWRGGQLTLGGFLAAYSAIAPVTRAAVTTAETFRHQADTFALEPYIAELARDRGLETDSLAVFLMEKRREQLMVEHLYQDSILSRALVSPAERRAYYRKNLAGFITYPKVTYALFHCDRRSEADSLAVRLRAGEKAEAILHADSLAGIYRGSLGERRHDEKGTLYYQLLFEELRPGEVRLRGPDSSGHTDALQLLTYDAGRQLSFEEAAHYLDESLQNLAAEKLLDSFIARHRKRMRIATRPDLVMLVRLTDAALY